MRPGEISTDILLQQQCSTLGKFQIYRAGWEVRVLLMITCGGMLRLFYDYFFLFKNLLVHDFLGSCAECKNHFTPFVRPIRPLLFSMFTVRCGVTTARPGTCKCREGKLLACNAVQERLPPPRKGNRSVIEVASNVQVTHS